MEHVVLDFSLSPERGALQLWIAVCVCLYIVNFLILYLRLPGTLKWTSFSFLFLVLFLLEGAVLFIVSWMSDMAVIKELFLLVLIACFYFPAATVAGIVFLFFSSAILRTLIKGTDSGEPETEQIDSDKNV